MSTTPLAVDPDAVTEARERAGADVSLVVAGRAFRGWLSVSITRTLDDCASSFSITGALVRIAPDASVQIRIGTDLVLSGYVDSVVYPTGSATVTISGRSKTADIVDCSARPGAYRGLTIVELARQLAEPYGVEVVSSVSGLTRPVPPVTVRRGTTVYQVIEKAARAARLLVTDDEQGRLTLVRADDAPAATTAVIAGQNVLSGEVTADSSQRYSTYTVRSQTAGDDQNYGAAVASIEGGATDPGPTRHRALIIDAPGLSREAAAALATWEAATRAGRSLTVRQSVRGWRQGDGRLWRVRERVRVVDGESGLDGELLVTAVTYTIDDGGEVTELTLVPQIAYLAEPVARRAPVKGKKPGAWKDLEGGVVVPKAAAP